MLAGINTTRFASKPEDEESGLAYFGARYYDPILGRFMGMDPVAPNPENIHSFNRYAYANNNPYKFVDPDGRLPILIPIAAAVLFEGGNLALESAYDAANPCGDCVRSSGVLIPSGPVAITGYKVGKALGQPAVRAESEVVLNAMARGRASETRVLNDLGLSKNTQKVTTTEGSAIPDGLTATRSIEIKDCISVACTKQIRIQPHAARASGRESVLITGERTRVAPRAEKAFDKIIRRTDLGPK